MEDYLVDEIIEVLRKDEDFVSSFRAFDLWLPFLKHKLLKALEVTKNLDYANKTKVLGIIVYKTKTLMLELEKAVRDNYSQGEDDIIKAIVKILIRDII